MPPLVRSNFKRTKTRHIPALSRMPLRANSFVWTSLSVRGRGCCFDSPQDLKAWSVKGPYEACS